MFGLSYLSDDRKRALRKLEDRVANSPDQRTREEAKLLIQEIMNEAKPYQTCDIYEATELKHQLMDQVSILVNLGKVQMAEAFQVHIKDIDFHIQTKQMELRLEEKAKLKQSEGPNLRDHSVTIGDVKRAKQKKQAMGRTRWVIGMDEDEEKK